MEFDVHYLLRQLPALRAGLLLTVEVSAIGIAAALAIGVVGACIRTLRVPVLGRAVAFYVELIRNTPLLVQIFFVFFGLPAIGMQLSIFGSGVLALALWGGAFQTETIRGGLAAVDRGLQEAARGLALSRMQYLRFIAIPLALRVCLPGMLNTSVSIIKNSAYLSAIGMQELTGVAFDRIASDFRALEMLAVLLAGYLAVVLTLSAAVRALEYRLAAPFAR